MQDIALILRNLLILVPPYSLLISMDRTRKQGTQISPFRTRIGNS